jgi:hypothetical protein
VLEGLPGGVVAGRSDPLQGDLEDAGVELGCPGRVVLGGELIEVRARLVAQGARLLVLAAKVVQQLAVGHQAEPVAEAAALRLVGEAGAGAAQDLGEDGLRQVGGVGVLQPLVAAEAVHQRAVGGDKGLPGVRVQAVAQACQQAGPRDRPRGGLAHALIPLRTKNVRVIIAGSFREARKNSRGATVGLRRRAHLNRAAGGSQQEGAGPAGDPSGGSTPLPRAG